MEIKDFDHVRVGSGYPASMDVVKIGSHESYGVFASTYNFTEKGRGRIQLRRNKSGNQIALFHFKFDEMELPAGWEDSTLIWEDRKKLKEKKRWID